MLHEIAKVRQYKNQPKRRWFYDPDGFDLLVWVDDKDKPIDFQLSFSNKVFTYMKCKLTYSVTDNAGRGYWWMAEILQQPSQKDRLTKNDEKEILTNFRKDAKDIDPIIINFVIERLLRYFNWE